MSCPADGPLTLREVCRSPQPPGDSLSAREKWEGSGGRPTSSGLSWWRGAVSAQPPVP